MSKEQLEEKIPPCTLDGLRMYLEGGYAPGHFLTAVLENNLSNAINRADNHNLAALVDLVKYIYNYVPSESWGSPERVRAWIAARVSERCKSPVGAED